MDDWLGSLLAASFVGLLVYLFVREIRGYTDPPVPIGAYDAWVAFARTLRGRFSPAAGIHHPRIDFLLSGRTAFFQFLVGNVRTLKGRTAVRVNVQGLSPGTLKLRSRGRKIPRPGTPADFDDYFSSSQVQPNSLRARMLGPANQAKLVVPLLGLRRFGDLTVELGSQSLSLEVGSLLTEAPSLLELASAMGLVLECFFGAAAPFPIELVDVANPQCARCSVCGCDLQDDVVRCLACQTPHHEDCWRFNTRCSTYGCGETRWAR